MTNKEKILLLYLLLWDVRMSWDKSRTARQRDKRIIRALALSMQEIGVPDDTISSIHTGIGLYLTGIYEGRILREGYELLDEPVNLHGFDVKKLNKADHSPEFLAEVEALMREKIFLQP